MTTAPMHMTAKKTLYPANPYGFSAQQNRYRVRSMDENSQLFVVSFPSSS